MITSQSVNEYMYQCTSKVAHISGILHPYSRLFLYVYVYKCSVQVQNGSVIRNVHLSSGPFKWSALYIDLGPIGVMKVKSSILFIL